jgi:hypothetical protein
MHPNMKLLAPGLVAALIFLATPTKIHALMTYKELDHTEAIPGGNTEPKDHYKSWSLFLVCNPSWIVANGDEGFGKLFHAFTAFGKAIGQDNLAVWFSNPPGQIATTENTDIERMSGYCKKFGLLPSLTPQVVTTTRHPDDPNVDAGGMVVANLSGDAVNSALVLTDLADQLMKTGLNQSSLDANEWGHKVASVVSTVMGSAACYLNKVSISIKTGVFNVKIEHASNGKC